MNNRESTVQKKIWARLGLVSTLFRVNTGRAWLSALGPKGVARQQDGSVFLEAARPIALGFANTAGEPVNGTADLNGWTSIEITPEMVGQKIAVFTSVETKRSAGGRTSSEQLKWCDQVTKAGGIAFVANSDEMAQDMLNEWVHHHAAKVWTPRVQHK
ncbi:hypothetical protein BIW22_20790 [Salmonella enterica]|nr:hypothetical protein [Salmonella enterica]EFO7976585.1 hypothetical protein [Salmonella enterica]